MNKAIIAGLVAGVLVVGLIFSPVFNGLSLQGAQAQGTGNTKKFTLVADEKEVQIAPDNALHPGGIMYNAMVFNGTVPSPVISVHQGDMVEITLVNEGAVIHSLDFHSALTTMGANSGPVKAGESKTWSFRADNAGVFFYHCSADGLNGIWEHIANGMYGGIVVHPHHEKPAKEFYVVFGEIYNNSDGGLFVGANGTGSFDIVKLVTNQPDLVLTNGMAHKYVPGIGVEVPIELNADAEVFKVAPGEQTRWYLVNAGPNDGISFHFIGSMIDVKDGSIKNRYGTQMKADETWWIPPGSGTVIEAVFPEAGTYVGVDHAMKDVLKGAAFAVVADNAVQPMAEDHPEGTSLLSMEETLKPQDGGMEEPPEEEPPTEETPEDFTITDFGMEGGNPTITVEGTAGGTTPEGTNDIYAYVFVTDNGTYAVTSHGAEDSTEVDDDIEWHAHGGIVLDPDNCVTAINEDGEASLEGNKVSVTGTNATALTSVMTVKISGTDLCVSEVFDSS